MEINSQFENILFDNVDIISPLSYSYSPKEMINTLPPPPNIIHFSNDAKPLNSYIRKCSDNTYDVCNISIAVKNNYNNFRENLLYSMYTQKYYYDIFSKYSVYSEWISKVNQLKQLQ